MTSWRRRMIVIGLLVVVHYLVVAGSATWVALTQVPRHCRSGALYDLRIVQDEPDGRGCDQYTAAFVSAYYGRLTDEGTNGALEIAEFTLLWMPVVAAGGLVGAVSMLFHGNSWFALYVSMHAVGALLWAIGIYAIWSSIQALRRRRRGT